VVSLLPVKFLSTPAPAIVGELDVAKQTEQVIANIKAVVEAAGSKQDGENNCVSGRYE